jgi:hypothetical protein
MMSSTTIARVAQCFVLQVFQRRVQRVSAARRDDGSDQIHQAAARVVRSHAPILGVEFVIPS